MLRKYSVVPGVLIEHVGNDLMVVVPGKNDYVKLSGEAAEVLLAVQAGKTTSGYEVVLANLEQLGVITGTGMSRRGLIKAGAIGAGAGIAVMAMPSVAAASSVGAVGSYQVVDSDVQFRIALDQLGAAGGAGESRRLDIPSLGMTGQGSPGDDGTYDYWTGFGVAPVSGTITGEVYLDNDPAVRADVSFVPESFTFPTP